MAVRRILIIDDEGDIREVTRVALEATRGWIVDTADSGAEGIRAAREDLPDAILLDMMMPLMDGRAVLDELRADDELAGVPVVLFTAKVQASDREAYGQVGADGLIVKPYDPMALAGEVEKILGWCQ